MASLSYRYILYINYSPTTSIISPSSKSASAISLSAAILSPSTIKLTPSPFFLLFNPAFFKNALTIAPHVVVGRTTSVMFFSVTLDRRTSLNVSPWDPQGSASESEISSVPSAPPSVSPLMGFVPGRGWARIYSWVILSHASEEYQLSNKIQDVGIYARSSASAQI